MTCILINMQTRFMLYLLIKILLLINLTKACVTINQDILASICKIVCVAVYSFIRLCDQSSII